MAHELAELKHPLPAIALIGGGALVLWFVASQSTSSPAKATGPSAIFPRAIGGQKGTGSRQSSRSSDSASVASQVIGDVLGQKTALVQAQDQLKLGELQLQTEQNIAYRESNVQAQQSVNSEVPPPNGWTQIFSQLIGAAAAFFGGPVGASVLGASPRGYGGYGSSGYPWMGGYAPSGGYSGYYPYSYFPSPYSYSGGPWGGWG